MTHSTTVTREFVIGGYREEEIDLEVTYSWDGGDRDTGINPGPEIESIVDANGSPVELTDEEEQRLLDRLTELGPDDSYDD